MKTFVKITTAGFLALFLLVFTVNVTNPQISGISQFAFGDRHWRAPVAQIIDLPSSGNLPGDTIRVLATWNIYYWNGTGWVLDSSQGLQGIPGTNGTNGTNGANGTNGSNGLDGKTVRNGAGVPSNGLGVDGDFYINTSLWTIYGPKANGLWGSGVSIVGMNGTNGTNGVNGVNGANGSNGVNGSTWFSGSSTPSSGLGVNGDYYLLTTTADVYSKSAGTWSVVANIKGTAGTNGTNGTDGVTTATFPLSLTSHNLAIATFGASGSSHSTGIVPDPGSSAGSTRFLNENGTWVAPSGGGGGSSPAGIGSEIQYRIDSSTFGAIPNSSVSGSAPVFNNLFIGGTSSDFINFSTPGFGLLRIRTGTLGWGGYVDAGTFRSYKPDADMGWRGDPSTGIDLGSGNCLRFGDSPDASQGTRDTSICRPSVNTVAITSILKLTPGSVGTCNSSLAGAARVAADSTWCFCNGSVWTALPATGSCI